MISEQTVFRALADPTRRAILLQLEDRDMTIAEVASHFDITRAAVKKHLVILGEGGLVSVTTRGRERINHLEPDGLKTAADWLNHFSRFWDDRLRDLKRAAEKYEENRDD
ncbi:MAG: helix-turn-helix transcriptional regulator [Rhodobiaceae bacterium]|nr:helix-turn-helix transcriptional regulator [Rhodobiaceae bacterium]